MVPISIHRGKDLRSFFLVDTYSLKESYFALIRAVKGYNQELGFKFTSYLTQTLKRSLWRYTALSRRREALALNNLYNLNDEGAGEIIDRITDPNAIDPAERAEVATLKIELDKALKKLSGQQPKMLMLYYGYERPVHELARVFNATCQEIRKEIICGREKLRWNALLRKVWREWAADYKQVRFDRNEVLNWLKTSGKK